MRFAHPLSKLLRNTRVRYGSLLLALYAILGHVTDGFQYWSWLSVNWNWVIKWAESPYFIWATAFILLVIIASGIRNVEVAEQLSLKRQEELIFESAKYTNKIQLDISEAQREIVDTLRRDVMDAPQIPLMALREDFLHWEQQQRVIIDSLRKEVKDGPQIPLVALRNDFLHWEQQQREVIDSIRNETKDALRIPILALRADLLHRELQIYNTYVHAFSENLETYKQTTKKWLDEDGFAITSADHPADPRISFENLTYLHPRTFHPPSWDGQWKSEHVRPTVAPSSQHGRDKIYQRSENMALQRALEHNIDRATSRLRVLEMVYSTNQSKLSELILEIDRLVSHCE